MRACYLILLVGAALRAQPASVEGVVVNQEDGHPMSGVHVSLTGREQAYGAVSRQDGHFSMAAVPAGSYQLEAERTGFLLARKPGDAFVRFVHLKAGQQVTGFTVTMTARAVLMGRVLDEAGDPVPGVGVGISSLPGSPPVSPFGLSLTNDRGEFRIVVLPGKYHLKAAPGVLRSGQTNDPPEIRTDGSSEMNYGDTYYPNSATAAGAAPVQANAGRDATGLDIRLARELNLSVSGSVTGPQGPASGATVWLRSAERQRAASAGADGRFRYTHVAAGTYEIFAQIAGAATMQSPPVEVRVAAGSEPDVPLLLSPGGDLTGTMEVEGEAGPGKRSVRLRPIGVAAGGSQVLGSTVGANGSFQMSLVAPGRYTVAVSALPEDAYVKSVTVDDVAAPEGILDFSRGARGAKIKVVVGRNGGQISGNVLDSEGQVIEGMTSAIVLTPNPGILGTEVILPVPTGKYSIKGLRPGKYRVAALLPYNVSPEMVNAVLQHAEEVEIREGDRLSKDLKLTTGEDADGK